MLTVSLGHTARLLLATTLAPASTVTTSSRSWAASLAFAALSDWMSALSEVTEHKTKHYQNIFQVCNNIIRSEEHFLCIYVSIVYSPQLALQRNLSAMLAVMVRAGSGGGQGNTAEGRGPWAGAE